MKMSRIFFCRERCKASCSEDKNWES